MQNKVSIEEQVAQLTKEQQDKIVRIGKVSGIIGSIIIVLMLLWTVVGMYLVMDPPLTMDIDPIKIGIGIIVGSVIGFIALLSVILFVKIKYPFYSDAKLKYITKARKK